MGKGRTLVRGTLLLTLSGLALRALGVLFQSWLAGRIGAEGMGLLQLVLTVGGFAGVLGAAGVRVATLQLTARAWGRGDLAGVRDALYACLRYALLASVAVGAGLILLAKPVSGLLLKEPRTVPALRTLGLLLPCPILAGTLRAAYTACGRVKELAAVELTERLLGAVGTFFLLALAGEEPAEVCRAVVLGSYGAGAFTFLVLWYKWDGVLFGKRRDGKPVPYGRGLADRLSAPQAGHSERSEAESKNPRPPSPIPMFSNGNLKTPQFSIFRLAFRPGGRRGGPGSGRPAAGRETRPGGRDAEGALPPVARTALPLGLNDCLRSGLGTLEQFLIPYGLEKNGSRQGALAAYGTISGMVFPLLWFPAEGIFALSELMVSELARLLAERDRRRTRALVRKSLLLTGLLALGVGTVFWLWGGFLGRALYHSPLAGRCLRIFAPMVLFLYTDAMVDGLQKGLGQQLHLVRYNSFTNVLDVLGLWLLLPRFGIWGYVFTYCLSHLVNLFLSLRRLLTVADDPALWGEDTPSARGG